MSKRYRLQKESRNHLLKLVYVTRVTPDVGKVTKRAYGQIRSSCPRMATDIFRPNKEVETNSDWERC